MTNVFLVSLCVARVDLIPFNARLAATLAPCVDDVCPTLLDILLGDLRHQIRKKDQVHIHTKLKNIRLLGEERVACACVCGVVGSVSVHVDR